LEVILVVAKAAIVRVAIARPSSHSSRGTRGC
jgi:hypothetical protein